MLTSSDALPLSERILGAYDDMTKSERRLADLLLGNGDALVLYSASDLSERAQVSKATTARFFRRMGYPSFKTAQREARRPEKGPSPETRRIGPLRGDQADIGDHLANDVQNLVRSVEQLRSDELALAVLTMARAEKLWVVGFGENYPLAHFARALLIRVKPDIRMIPIGGFSSSGGVRVDPDRAIPCWRSGSAGAPAAFARSCARPRRPVRRSCW